MHHTNRLSIAIVLVALAMNLSSASARDSSSVNPSIPQAPSAEAADTAIGDWPSGGPRYAAKALIARYGRPDEATPQGIVWRNRGVWKRIAVYRNAPTDNFPEPHSDFVENTVNYTVPSDKIAAIRQFDPAMTIDRSRGTLGIRSGSEKFNILALNLADKIIRGKRSPASARVFLRRTVAEEFAGKSSPYSERLMFTPLSKRESPPTAIGDTMESQPRWESAPPL